MRKEFITAKYVDHKYARKTCTSAAAKMIELFEAVQSRDLLSLIQVYAEGVELMEPLPEAGQVRPTQRSHGYLSVHTVCLNVGAKVSETLIGEINLLKVKHSYGVSRSLPVPVAASVHP